jgi:hypothetical protein
MNFTIIQTIEISETQMAFIQRHAPFQDRAAVAEAVSCALNPYGQTADKRINLDACRKLADNLVEMGYAKTREEDAQLFADSFSISDLNAEHFALIEGMRPFTDDVQAGVALRSLIEMATGATPRTLTVNALVADLQAQGIITIGAAVAEQRVEENYE